MLGTFFEASGPLDAAVISGGPLESSPTADVKGLTEVALGTLGEILGAGGAEELADRMGDGALEAEGGEAGVLSLPDDLRDALADLVDGDGVATRWAESEELVADNWRPNDTLEALQRMQIVAQAAREAGNRMFYWWSL